MDRDSHISRLPATPATPLRWRERSAPAPRVRPAPPAGDAPLLVVANREPYVHERTEDGGIVVRRPAGGLVTAIEPLLRSRGGTWIAHGSGSADAETVRGDGVVRVPPEAPRYALKRVFLSDSEVEAYYEGFSNEALWPLCHRVHQRPTFRHGDWTAYREVNRRFAAAAVDGADEESPILVQDYQLALVPRFIRNAAPHARISHFWHIPWPAAGTFEICPWANDLLEGLLGSDVVGFHTDEYGRNFLESVERSMPGARVSYRERSVTYRGRRTLVRSYPISVEWPYPAASRADGAQLRRDLGIDGGVHVSVAVDRTDYTKGLLERVHAVEELMAASPELRGRYMLVQIAAPSRQSIERYRRLAEDLEREVARVNERFARGSWRPILLRLEATPPEEVRRVYAMADSAVVTPLHDGMNLVAKEYVASCTDGRGALVLSRFTGAAAELRDALLVNPYDAREVAAAIRRAIDMAPMERIRRMRAMQEAVARNTIHDWASRLLGDLAAVRPRLRDERRDALLRARET